MLPSRSLLPTNHFGTNCCCSGPYLPPTTSEPTAQHVAVAVPTSHQPLRNRLLSMLPSRSLLPTNHFGTDRSACCRRGPYFLPTTSEPTAQHVAVAVPTSHQPLRNRPLCMLPSRSLLPTNHFGTECSACCRRGPYFPPTTSEPTAQHVAVAVPTSHQPLRKRLHSMLPSRSLLPPTTSSISTNHFGTDCSACCRRGPYFPPTTSEPTAQHVAVAVPTSHQPLRNRLLSMLPSRSLLPTNHFGTTPHHVAVAVPTPTNHFVAVPISHQPLRNRLLSMLLSRSLLPTNHFGTDSTACCRRGPYSHQPLRRGPYFHQPLRNRLLSMLLSRSLLPTNHFGTDCSACCRRGPYFPPTTSEPTAQHVALAVPTSPTTTNHFGTDCSACCRHGPYFPPTTSEPTAQHVAVAVPTPTNHFGTDCSACCRRGPYSHQPLRRGPYFTPTTSEPTAHCRGPYFPPTTSEPTAQHVAVAVPIAPINHFGTDCSACCRRGPYFPPTTSSRSLFHTNHFGTDCSACFRRGPYFPPITSEPTAQHVAFAVPTSCSPSTSEPSARYFVNLLPCAELSLLCG